MGQYYVIVCLDRGEFLHPHKFGQGLKLREFSGSGDSIMQAVALLCANGNGRGAGDLVPRSARLARRVGSWAGGRIVVAGDYGDAGKFLEYLPARIRRKLGVLPPATTPAERRARAADQALCGNDLPNLYNFANAYLRDVSDAAVDMLTTGSHDHPLAALDRGAGWRQRRPYRCACGVHFSDDEVGTTDKALCYACDPVRSRDADRALIYRLQRRLAASGRAPRAMNPRPGRARRNAKASANLVVGKAPDVPKL